MGNFPGLAEATSTSSGSLRKNDIVKTQLLFDVEDLANQIQDVIVLLASQPSTCTFVPEISALLKEVKSLASDDDVNIAAASAKVNVLRETMHGMQALFGQKFPAATTAPVHIRQDVLGKSFKSELQTERTMLQGIASIQSNITE